MLYVPPTHNDSFLVPCHELRSTFLYVVKLELIGVNIIYLFAQNIDSGYS